MSNIFYLKPKISFDHAPDGIKNQLLSQSLSPKELIDRAENLRDLMLTLTLSLETMQKQITQR